jgi:hypothetical protein
LNAVRLASVPVIVKSPDDQAVLLNERALFSEYGVILTLGEIVRFIEMAKEGWLVSDDQIVPRRGGAL